ncbi:hypothetical protein [Arsukibacterium sp.]|uniref:hypothetical protein n=1 Tax=Arsukibacterium sp. TaxID=1977258 RepID=UPI002FDB6B69
MQADQHSTILQVCSSERFVAWLVDDHLLIYDKADNKCEWVNALGSMLFLLLAAKPSSHARLVDDIYQLAPHLPKDNAHLALCLAQWQQRGWLQLAADGSFMLSQDMTGAHSLPRGVMVQLPTAETLAASDKLVQRIWVNLNGQDVIAVSFYQALQHDQPFQQAFCPEAIPRLLAVLQGVTVAAPAVPVKEKFTLSFVVSEAQVTIYTQDISYQITDESYALSMLATLLLRLSYAEAGMMLSAHAAAIGKAGKQILLPANSGSGKSTLTATLLVQDWEYYGDDVVALAPLSDNAMQTLPFRTAVGLKPGAWPLLTALYPILPSLGVTEYAGKQAKFLPLSQTASSPWQSGRIYAVVFPRFSSVSVPCLRPLNLCETIAMFLVSGVSFMQHSTDKTANLTLWLAWLQQMPCYEMLYNDSDSARRMLEPLI